MTISRNFLLLPLLALFAPACSTAHADEGSSNASLTADGTAKTYHCTLTQTAAGKETSTDDATVSLTSTQWMRVARTFTYGSQVTPGTLQGFATFANGNLSSASWVKDAERRSVDVYTLGDVAFVTELDGTKPRLRTTSGELPCTKE